MKPLLTTIFLFTTLFFATPALSNAAEIIDSFGANPDINTDGTIATDQGFVPCSGVSCTPCHVVVLFNTVLKWFMGIAFLIFAFLAMKAGVSLVTSGGNPSALSSAKSSFTNAFIGLIIILAAWLIVDTLMRNLLDGGNGEIKIANYGPWASVKCDVATQTTPGSATGYFEGDLEYELADPNDQTLYSGTPKSGGHCTPIPDSQLVPFPASADATGGHRDLADTVKRFMAMRAEAAKVKIDLKVNSAYRSPDDQTRAWNNNGCRLVNGKAVCAKLTAAVPCSLGGSGSNHTSGNAVDIANTRSVSSKNYLWLKDHGSAFGFKNILGAKDPPHWSASGN